MDSATLRAVGHALANSPGTEAPTEPTDEIARFTAIYDENVAFVHRGARRLGVPEAAIEDVVQEVFLVAYRRQFEFHHASSLRTWLYGILVHVARSYRRTAMRAGLHGVIVRDASREAECVEGLRDQRPDALAEKADAWRMLQRILAELDNDKREIFVLAELEQLPVPEIAQLLEIKLNTAYSRLRLARAAFEDALARVTRSP